MLVLSEKFRASLRGDVPVLYGENHEGLSSWMVNKIQDFKIDSLSSMKFVVM